MVPAMPPKMALEGVILTERWLQLPTVTLVLREVFNAGDEAMHVNPGGSIPALAILPESSIRIGLPGRDGMYIGIAI
jgi:hypothetical protein